MKKERKKSREKRPARGWREVVAPATLAQLEKSMTTVIDVVLSLRRLGAPANELLDVFLNQLTDDLHKEIGREDAAEALKWFHSEMDRQFENARAGEPAGNL
jgi:hypothetical protein